MGDREETGVRSTVDGGEGSPLVRGGTAWETTGGRSGGSRVADDGETGVDRCRRGDRCWRGNSRGTGILDGLSRGGSAGMMGFRGKRVEQLRVSSAGLTLTAASKVAAPRDEQSSEDDDKDRGEASGERCPMYVDEAEAVVGLIEADIRRLVGLVRLDMQGGLVRHLNCRGWGGGACQFGLVGKILLDEHFLTVGIN